MNIENINTMIAWVKTREWKTKDWMDTSQCFAGMVGAAMGNPGRGDLALIADTLGIGFLKAEALFILHDHLGPEDDGNARVRRSWDAFQAMPLEDQNAAVVDMLETMLSTGGDVIWSKVEQQPTFK